MTLPLLKFCKENQIELIVLYPNATHIIQPLDVAIFHPLKDAYRKVLRTWRLDNNVVDFQKSMFPPVLKLALESCDLNTATINGFRACGLYPLNADVVNYNILSKKYKNKASSVPPLSTSKVVSSDSTTLLHVFENDLISPATLEDFKAAELDDAWMGDLKYYELFESWRKLRKLCSGIEVEIPEATLTESFATVKSPEVDVEMPDASTSNPLATENSPEVDIEWPDDTMTEPFSSERSAEVNIEMPHADDSSSIINLDNCDFEPINFQIESEIPVSEVELVDESGNRVTAAIITVIPNDKSKSDISSVYPMARQDEHTDFPYTSDESQVSADKIENDICSANDGFAADTDSNNLHSNHEASCDMEIHGFHGTSEDFSNSNSVIISNKDNILDLTMVAKDRNNFSNIFSTSKLNSNSAKDHDDVSNVGQNSKLENDTNEVSVPGVLNYTIGGISTVPETCTQNANCTLNITSESNSSICSSESKNESQLSPTFQQCFPIPTFTSKKKKKGNSQNSTNVALVEDLLVVLQKKDYDKEEKKQQILLNKKEREKARVLKEREQNVVKSFHENKKKKLQEKKEMKLEIQKLKKLIKSKGNKENETELMAQIQNLNAQLDEIENSIISQDMELLQAKIKIKQENL